MKAQTREDPKILAAAERQMRAWTHAQQVADRSTRLRADEGLGKQLASHLTISREAGAGGSEIARLVGRKLDWDVLDRDLLDQVADRYNLPRPMLELVDETTTSWVHDVLGTWFDRRIIPHEKFLVRLRRVLQSTARRGKVVFVGRGAQFLLPRQQGLAVRIIAPQKYRVERIMREQGLDTRSARRLIDNIDAGRREFVRRYFHRDIDEPHLYDLVVNVERIGLAGTVDQIVAALGR